MFRSLLACRWLRILSLIAFALCTTSVQAHEVRVSSVEQPVKLTGQWRWQVGDDLSWASALQPSGTWATTNTEPSTAPSRGYDYVWFRLTLQLSPEFIQGAHHGQASLGVLVDHMWGNYELYANGRLVGAQGSLPPHEAPMMPRARAFEIPWSNIPETGTVILALRSWYEPKEAALDSGRSRLLGPESALGNYPELRDQAELQFMQKKEHAYRIFAAAAVLIIIGLYHLLLWRRRREFLPYLQFGWLSLLLGLHAVATQGYGTVLDFDAYTFWLRVAIEAPLLHAIEVFIFLFLCSAFERNVPRRVRQLLYAWVAIGVLRATPLPVVTRYLLSGPSWDVTRLSFFVFLAIGAALIFQAIRAKHPNAIVVLIGCGISAGCMVFDLLVSGHILPRSSLYPLSHIGFVTSVFALAIALANGFRRTLDHLDSRNQQLTGLNSAMNRFVPYELLGLLGRQSVLDVERGDQVQIEITVLFADIRSFTTLAEARTPQETLEFINRYLAHVEPHIHNHGGLVGTFLGDGLMVLYPGEADRAVASAVDILQALDGFNEEQRQRGDTPIRIGIGLNTGTVMLGALGGDERLNCSVIGDAVNLASRIEGMTKQYGTTLLMSENTHRRLKHPESFGIRAVDRVVAKGKSKAMTLYEVFDGEPEPVREQRRDSAAIFEQARQLYLEQRFAEALSLFEMCAAQAVDGSAEDAAARLHIERCQQYLASGVPEQWDGSYWLAVK